METVNGKGQILDGHIFIYPADEERVDIHDLQSFMRRNIQYAQEYKHNMQMYLGNHDILKQQRRMYGPDNRLVANLPHYIVDTYNGFFTGIPPKISLDDEANNKALQQWNDTNSLQDKLSEISKQTDIYGRSFAFVYQDEASNTCVAYASPVEAFMIYDDTVARKPFAFVRYWRNTESGLWCGTIYYADGIENFAGTSVEDTETPNPYSMVPAVEFYGNEERQGVFDNVKTLIDALDKVLSQKANQVEYFDNAYLKILGLDLDEDGDGLPDANLIGNQMIYSPNVDASNADVGFISKPDGDNMQEHIIDRLVSMIYQVSMVANLNDEAFAGNSSGVALQYKLLPMRNMAANKERKFRQALRKLYRVIFSAGKVTKSKEAWQDLVFDFKRNLPINMADEADTLQKLSGIVSKETAFRNSSLIDDPKKEIERMKKEKQEAMEEALKYAPSATDQMKNAGDTNDDEE
ncbi:phage portal protein [Limosilactobacillus caviae]|jgi:SPP1 family phage portal protein|uniref:Phage portal protein n=1 Tax=Limosilactobacillus caviae TaxID=1769424 RepID=A0ABQ2CA27_9LACO|nr:phage portal protein [Limosilactobacillus caviae]MCD7125120.1 phage portal protein [Limosilactobacillus caviae]MRH47213.1 phage portal protein [Limosilactobacillus reuteri]GGI64243.1 hypothetical protein GCM10011459_20770 [Limosilactobacillus caviae]